MGVYKSKYMEYMDANNIEYNDIGDDNVRIPYDGKNLKTINIYASFEKDGNGLVHFYCFDIGEATKAQFAASLLTCNSMNVKYRWVKFSVDIDNNNSIAAEIDAKIDEATCGEACATLVTWMVDIVDEAYPEFMKAIWG